MRVSNIRKNAEVRSQELTSVKNQLRSLLVMLECDSKLTHEWYRNGLKDQFYTYISPSKARISTKASFRNQPVEVSRNGLHAKMSYNSDEGGYEVYAYLVESEIPEGGYTMKLLRALQNRRRQFMNRFYSESAKKAKAWLLAHEAEVCQYPTVHRFNRWHLSTRMNLVWSCGVDADENAKRSEEWANMFGNKITYCYRENLKDYREFYPCIWESDSQLEAVFPIDVNFDLHVTRYEPKTETVRYTPAMNASLVVKARDESISTAYSAALQAIRCYDHQECESKFLGFCNDMETAEWVTCQNGVQATIPVIWDMYTDEILNKLRRVYPEDLYSFRKVEAPITLFSYIHDEDKEMHTCIEVTIKTSKF